MSSHQQASHQLFDLQSSTSSSLDQWKTSSYWYRRIVLTPGRKEQVDELYFSDAKNRSTKPLICSAEQAKVELERFIRKNCTHTDKTIKSNTNIVSVIDVVSFNDEWQWLLIRLHELHEIVSKFIVVECEYTFTNQSKPMHYRDEFRHWPEFKIFEKQIVMYECDWRGDDFPFVVLDENNMVDHSNREEWARERWLRVQMNKAFDIHRDRAATTMAVVADVDQVPRAESLHRLLNVIDCIPRRIHFQSLFSVFRLGCLDEINFLPHARKDPALHGPVVQILYTQDSLKAEEAFHWRSQISVTEQVAIPCQAWHCSNCMTSKQFLNKISSFSHAKQVGVAYQDPFYLADLYETCSFGRQRLDRNWENLPARHFLTSTVNVDLQQILPI